MQDSKYPFWNAVWWDSFENYFMSKSQEHDVLTWFRKVWHRIHWRVFTRVILNIHVFVTGHSLITKKAMTTVKYKNCQYGWNIWNARKTQKNINETFGVFVERSCFVSLGHPGWSILHFSEKMINKSDSIEWNKCSSSMSSSTHTQISYKKTSNFCHI